MNKYTFLLLALVLPLSLKAQTVTVHKIDVKPSVKAIDVEPQFPGGTKGFYKYISKSIAYDKGATPQDMQGVVTISMAIEKDGHISDVTIVNGISEIVDREVLRVINASPLWKPGKQKGLPIKVRYTFKIQLSNT